MSLKYVGINEDHDEVYEAETDEALQDIAYRLALDVEIYNRDHEDQKTVVVSDVWPPVEAEESEAQISA